MSRITNIVRTIFFLFLLLAELLALAVHQPQREFAFNRSANLIFAYPTDGGKVSERDVDAARDTWVEQYGKGRESPGRYARVLRDSTGLAFAAITVVRDDE